MKKLLITTMAAVSVGLCAKAEDANYEGTKTSFEDYVAGSTLTVNDEYDLTWTSSATDPLFVISNKTDFANWTKPSRPDYWATSSSDENALTIDTDAPLFCKVNNRNTPYDFSSGPIFFDSVVQFTATDVAAEPESGDKLRVWLYESSEQVAQENSGEVSSTKKLVVTAAYFENDTYVKKHYYTDVEIEPDSWHRLTIKSFINNGFVTFSVWVDETLVSAEGVTEFLSLQYTENLDGTAIQCVAFDGKGAVDDIVFTTTAPEFAKEPEEPTGDTYAIITAGENATITVLDSEGNELDAGKLDVEITTVGIAVAPTPTSGYVLQSAIFNGNAIEDLPDFDPATKDYYFEINVPNTDGVVAKGSEFAFSVVMVANSGVVTVGSTTVQFDDNGKITNITTANNGQVVTGEITDDMFADYYAVSVVNGKLVIAIDPEVATPQINETAADKGDAIVVTDAAVALGVTNAKAGLWYGAQAYSDAACAENDKLGEPTGWVKASGDTITVTAAKPTETKDELTVVVDKAFFKVVVDDQDHTPPAEGQE